MMLLVEVVVVVVVVMVVMVVMVVNVVGSGAVVGCVCGVAVSQAPSSR